MPDEGYMDAAGIDTPDAGDDTLREQVSRAVCAIAIGSERVETVMDIIQEHTAKAELRADARARADEIKERFRADRAEAAIGRAMQVYRQHTTSGASAWCKCIACDMARALAYDGTGAEHG